MSLMWDHYWPAIVAAVVIGVLAGGMAYGPPRARRSRLPGPNAILAGGALIAFAVAALWHGPLGAGDRFAARVESAAAAELRRLEMVMVTAKLNRKPLSRELVLAGPADDFQQRELVRIMGGLPAVNSARWANPPAPVEAGR